MSDLRSVLLLCWRDTGHPQGGGSETYLQRIGAQLAASGIEVTLRTARYPGAPRWEVVDGVRVNRAGGRYSVYVWALLAMVAARMGLGPLQRVRPAAVIDTQNGLPFLARLVYGRRVVVLVHHCHREQWPVAGPVLGRLGWFVESKLSPWLNRRNQYVTVSLPSARDLVALGVDNERIAVVRNGLDEAPGQTLSGPRAATPRVVVLSRLVPHKQIEDALEAVAQLRRRTPGSPNLHIDVVGGGWWRQRLIDHVHRLGISDAVTFHGHVDDVTKHHVLQSSWVQLLPSRKEGWGLAVVEAAQHGVPTIGYRSSGGLSDSIIDGVTGILVDSHAELVDQLERLLADPVLRDQLGAKARVRSAEFSWQESVDGMRSVLEAVPAGRFVSGVV
ncbi:glycosyltransferase family 4 protein [Mycobacterium ulcerans]|uniref:Glycosyltransferase n=3 Tax=Mycobacterium ulcerans TaxID=1809 RepID=A0PMY8_MYCUA|nr:glycosyltransferase family 4 protein [Mycobacterium ulcerans]EUA91644.1 glycosyl transferases group 1 family protein [Mycobacterium ulcerans str. Harvey]ABL03707.1 glycosyltransferase [Mycobacterium ulcerans Agy99]MEB3905587.1 glycosyltransferase family 4 protein [Mycobacterium ulcerans]MEB3909770.1 glycosyltransferase family 4 protein [Mycobacterium ulcerans]MEB3920033.1 glycosyltransferase family 4 protein [Mycobacterium ulcerans]